MVIAMKNKENTNKKYIWFILIGLLIVVTIFATGITLSLEKTVEENGLRMTKGDNGYILEKVLNKNLQEIVVPDEVVEIREGAFAGCNRLEILNIPFIGKDNVKTVDRFPIGYLFGEKEFEGAQEVKQYYRGFTLAYPESAFYYIPTSLRKVVVRGGEVPLGAFQGCDMLTDVVLPDSATTIGNSALEGCVAIKTLVVGENVTKVGGNAFDGVTPEKYTAPTSVLMRLSPEKAKEVTIRGGERIDDYTFSSCPELTTVLIEEGVKEIGSYAFYSCNKLRLISLSKSVESVGRETFGSIDRNKTLYYDGNIEDWFSIVAETPSALPTNVVEWYVQGKKVEELVIPDGMTEIPDHHFCGWSFSKLYVPASVKELAGSSFYNTKIREGVWYDGTVEQWCAIDFEEGFSNPLKSNGRLYIQGKRVLELTIPNTITATNGCFIGGAFKKIIIPDTLKKIGHEEFAYDNLLEEVVFEDGLEEIETGAFLNCASLKKVSLPSSLKKIGLGAFRGCTTLKTVEFNEGLETIEDSCFTDCKKLKEVVLPESVKRIGYGTFSGCENLRKIEIPGSIKKIADATFFQCNSLEEITLHDGLKEIGAAAFLGCSKLLSEIVIPDSVTTIGSGAFKDCESLEKVILPSELRELGARAFYGCTALTTVEFAGDKLGTIGDMAFADCSSLVRIELPEGVWYIAQSAFWVCENLEEIWIPASTYFVDYNAFLDCNRLEHIYYGGTKSEWREAFRFKDDPMGITVHCSNGDIVYD